MMTTLGCPCGASLRVREEARGKRVRCPKCAGVVAVPAEEDDGFRIIDAEGSEAGQGILFGRPQFQRMMRPRGAAARRRVIPWEVWTVLLVLGLNLVGNVVNCFSGAGAVAGVGVITGLILMMGIHSRAGWAWWWATIASGIALLLGWWVLSNPSAIPAAARPDPTIVMLGMIGNVVTIVALVVARMRGAYEAE